ncbi:unnamed protein product [Prunus armeniaca]
MKNYLFILPKKSGNDNKDTPSASNVDISIPKELFELGSQVVEPEEFDIASLEGDPGKCIPICEHPINQRDEIRMASSLNFFAIEHVFLKLDNVEAHLRKFALDLRKPRTRSEIKLNTNKTTWSKSVN